MKKRTFILLEILIALLLVTLCAAPLVNQPLKLYRAEMKFLEQMERERLADWTFSEIKEMLLKNEIRWEELPERGSKTDPISLPPAKIEIPGWKTKEVKRTFTLECMGEAEGKAGAIYRTFVLEIDFLPKLFQKKKKEEETPKKKESHYVFRLLALRRPLVSPPKEAPVDKTPKS
ncbi:MAG: hypothetical protein V4487_06525 [Chlamydiota bacterium]